ncbi:MAG: aminoglycoside phosphotransferase family protein [Proteobacteria bacterium]|nr:MAG: aminoglycoside phosphotransferase family protein [Pseudomonadota bacterium]TDJ71899.1 MAG: aminoglycoside phosphotransferase family protein [Pseudomonadota bacterium]
MIIALRCSEQFNQTRNQPKEILRNQSLSLRTAACFTDIGNTRRSYSTGRVRHLSSRQDDLRAQSPLPEVPSVVRKIADRFLIDGQLVKTSTLVGGHIHDSCLASYLEDGRINTYVHQRINRNVVQYPVRLMDNVSRVVAHVRAKLERSNCVDMKRRVLTLIPGRESKPYCIDKEGEYWRTYRYIENTLTHDVVTPSLAHEAAAAFGNFAGLLQDLSGPRLHETILNFHNTPKRYQDFCRAIDDDPHNRTETARSEVACAVVRQKMASILTDAQASGELPERIVHNDTKINNVLFDISSGEALCVIDLDTVMPGLTAYDFGDLIRTMINPSREDERPSPCGLADIRSGYRWLPWIHAIILRRTRTAIYGASCDHHNL